MALKINIGDTWKYVDSAKINIGDVWKDVIFAVYATVTLTGVTSITKTTAISGGLVVSDGNSTVTSRGVCWSINMDPTTGDTKTIDGSGTGVFTSNLTGLTVGTTYYIRAYATNSVGTSYSDNYMFTTTAYIIVDVGLNHSMLNQLKLWGWGYNQYGQLGDNTIISKRTPISIYGNKTFCQISCGFYHSIGLDKNGKVWSWGYNPYGQLGDNTTVSKSTPVAVCGNKTFCQISAGIYHNIGIDKNGKAWSWGYNGFGQLGDNTTVSKLTPVSIYGNKTFCRIIAGFYYNSFGIDKNGKVWSWGYNVFGQLGNNTATDKWTPVSILGANKTFCQISGGYYALALDKNGKLWAWGQNSSGQLGDNSAVSKSTPVAVCGNNKTFCKISGKYQTSFGIDKNGKAWGWGHNGYGQLGDNSAVSISTPVAVYGSKTFCSIISTSHSIAIDKNDKAWSWGYNNVGQLGDNTIISKRTPVAICGLV